MKHKTMFVVVMVGLLIISNNFAFSQTSEGSKPIATEKKADKGQITSVPPGTGKSSCSARSEDKKKSCSVSCKDGQTASCSNTEDDATCDCN